MRVSINWVKRLLNVADLGMSIEQLQAQLTVRVAEFESGLEVTGPPLDGIVIGKVLTCQRHPHADKLSLTTVDAGGPTPLAIVCGAPNVAVGLTVAVATVGATVSIPTKDGVMQSVTIKPVKLRGEPSEGMLCAADEIGLGRDHAGIMVLDDDFRPGTPLRMALGLGDTVLVIENHAITHRPDLWGQLGWAREIAAICGLPGPTEPDITLPASARIDGAPSWSVQIRDDGCSVYAGAVLRGVAQMESPAWMRALLESVGVRPLGLLVDITNFIMLELGEPMHAFDRRDISGTGMTVRSASAEEPFTTLDGREHRLLPSDLVIADANRALALAGIMGGHGSMIRADTTEILLEAAIFSPERIRRTRKRLGLATDSSARFEKGLYPELAPAALNRAISLLRDSCPTAQVVAVFCSGHVAGAVRTIPFSTEQTARLTGLTIPAERQVALLERLGFVAAAANAPAASAVQLQVRVPWWRRKDVTGAADLIEEIARSHGYHHIIPETPRLLAGSPIGNPLRDTEHRCRHLMSALGWDEVATYAFTSQVWAEAVAVDLPLIHLTHPLSSDQSVMRPSLVPNLLQALANNLKQSSSASIYEIGKRYSAGLNRAKPGRDLHEEMLIAGAYSDSQDNAPFYGARDAALALLCELGYHVNAEPVMPTSVLPVGRWLTPTRTALLIQRDPGAPNSPGRTVGVVTELPRPLRELAACPAAAGYFEIQLELLLEQPTKPVSYQQPSRFPLVERQFTWDCPEALPFAELEAEMRYASGGLCTSVALDSIYRGSQIEPGHKAVSVRIFLQAQDRTLDEKNLAQVHEHILARVQQHTAARLRQ